MSSEVKNRRKTATRAVSQDKRGEFINHTFDEGTKAKFKKWAAENSGDLGSIIDRLLDDGYNVSIKRDDFNEAFACYIIAASADSSNAGYILTGRSHEPQMAFLAAIYRHYVVFETEWPTEHSRSSRVDDE